jgi:hypothetical protein
MTQAMNLANFSNYLDASGQMAPTVLNAVVPISKGGTASATASAARTALGLAIGTDVAAQAYAFPSGGIIMWSGSVASIPSGWFLCNGSNGTPNLLNRFVLAAGSTYAVGATGGNKDAILVSHTHTATVSDPGHTHTADQPYPGSTAANGGGYYGQGNTRSVTTSSTGITVSNSTVGVGGTDANMPPYYALAFIMKS